MIFSLTVIETVAKIINFSLTVSVTKTEIVSVPRVFSKLITYGFLENSSVENKHNCYD